MSYRTVHYMRQLFLNLLLPYLDLRSGEIRKVQRPIWPDMEDA